MSVSNLFSISGWATLPSCWTPLIDSMDLPIEHTPLPWWECMGDSAENNLLIQKLEQTDGMAIILGWSLGGLNALIGTAAVKDQVAGLILVASTACMVEHDNYPGVKKQLIRAMRARLCDNPQVTIRDFAELCINYGKNVSTNEDRDFIEQFLLQANSIDFHELRKGLRFLQETDVRKMLPEINVPVLVIHGDSDAVMPLEGAKFLAHNLRKAELQIVSGGNHALLHTGKEIVTRLIRKYLSDYFGL